MKSLAAFALAVILAPAALLAQQPARTQLQTFAVNPDTSQVRITLKTNHEIVNGDFRVRSGSVQFDPGTPGISGSIAVAAASGKTGNDTRDKRMNKEILRVDRFTSISFDPKTYTGNLAPSGDSNIRVTGIFTLLGAPHEITIPMQVHIDGGSATAKAHFVVPYVQWGLKNPSIFIWKAENDVAIDLNLVGTISR